MSRPEQLNTTVAPEVYTRFSGAAAERQLSNAALLRNLVEEFIEACDAGRAIFQKEAAPRLDASVNGLVHQLKELVIELDRAQADNAKMYGKLIADWNGGEDASREAQRRLWQKFREQDAQSLAPFKKGVSEVLVQLTALPADLRDALEPRLAQMSEQLDRSIELASEPRTIRALYLGDDRILSLWFLSGCGALLLAMGALFGLILPGLFDASSLWQSGKLIDSPAQMCRLIESEYGTSDCAVPGQERELGLRIIAHEDQL